MGLERCVQPTTARQILLQHQTECLFCSSTHKHTLPLTPFNLVFNTYCRIRRPSYVWLCVSRPATWAVLHCQDYTGGAVEIELWHHRCKRSSLWPNSYRLVTWIRQDSDSAKPNTKDLQTEGLHHCTVLYSFLCSTVILLLIPLECLFENCHVTIVTSPTDSPMTSSMSVYTARLCVLPEHVTQCLCIHVLTMCYLKPLNEWPSDPSPTTTFKLNKVRGATMVPGIQSTYSSLS